MTGCLMLVAIIPARGGSKRIPRKNIKPFAGRPMLHYAVEAARGSGLFDRIVVSTDCPEIAREAQKAGAEVPFTRPAQLAGDTVVTADVLVHAVQELERESGTPIVTLACIYPPVPLLKPESLRAAWTLMQESGAPMVLPVASFPAPIHRGFVLQPDGSAVMLWPEHMNTRSNDLPEVWHDAGQFYLYDRDAFMAARQLYLPGMKALALPRITVQDVDTPEDWQTAEKLYALLRQSAGRVQVA